MATETIFSDPSVQFLQRLLENFQKGEITLPRFQRPFVWDKARRLALFDSVRRGIPIGSLMIWETRAVGEKGEALVIPKTSLGPFVLPKVPDVSPRRFLLDGEQRLMTLYFALYSPSAAGDPEGDEPTTAFEVFYDLQEETFATRDDFPAEPSPARYFPLRSVFFPRGVLRFQREMERALVEGLGANSTPDMRRTLDEKVTRFTERSDSIAESVRQYKVPVTVMATDDLPLVSETFKRVNSQGLSMSEAHMMNAISWQSSFDLLERFDELRSGLEDQPLWTDRANLDDDVLLRVSKRLLDHDVYSEDVSTIAPKLRDGKVLRRVGESMGRCAAYLASRGIRNPGHMPNVMQLVVLGVVFDAVHEPSSAALDRLEDWLWFTSYSEVFARMVRGSVYRHLEDQALALARGEAADAPLRRLVRRPLPRFNFKSTRSRALAWMFARRMMGFDEGGAADALAAGGSEALQMLATAPKGRSDVATRSAIRVLCAPEHIKALRVKLRDGLADAKLLDAQVLTEDALRALRAKPRDVLRFVEFREKALNDLEQRRFEEIYERLFHDAGVGSDEDD